MKINPRAMHTNQAANTRPSFMKTTLLFSALSLACASVGATGSVPVQPEPVIPNLYVMPSAGALAKAASEATAGIDANISGTVTGKNTNDNSNTNANTNNVGASNAFNSNARSYSLVAGGSATPLPSGLCPKGDSFYLQVLGGLLFTYSTSTTRTEFDCLEKVLASIREQTQPRIVQTLVLEPGEQPHPICTPDKKKPPVVMPGGKKRPQLTCEKWIKKAH